MKSLFCVFLFLCSCASVKSHQSTAADEPERNPASLQHEKRIQDCGQHPFQQDKAVNSSATVKFKPVRIGKHGFILQQAWHEGPPQARKYFVNATHFSAAFPRHLFSTMIKIKLSKSEYEAVQMAFAEHPGQNPKGRFAPFLVFSRQPMKPGQRSPNDLYGFCMKDFERILNGERQALYGGKKNVIYGNLRKWNPAIAGVFAPYELKNNVSPVVEISLGDGTPPTDGETFGDVTRIFYHPHRPATDEFVNRRDAKKYWLRSEQSP